MPNIFPDPIRKIPLADIPIPGLKAYLSQGDSHQILFMEFTEAVEIPEHNHESQWGVVLAGRIELTIGGEHRVFEMGDQYFIPAGEVHAAKIFAGYADITFFNQPDRYQKQAG
jgi:mannose-6-phosphate isomerase-like protein (cupin superfamily)